MSSDNQYTALGPAIVGFQTDGTSIDRGAEIAGNSLGIRGTCQGSTGDGVHFSYRIVARRKDIETPRLAKINLPKIQRPTATAESRKRKKK